MARCAPKNALTWLLEIGRRRRGRPRKHFWRDDLDVDAFEEVGVEEADLCPAVAQINNLDKIEKKYVQ